MMRWVFVTALVALSLAASDDTKSEEKAPVEEARLLISKAPLSMYAVENMDLVVQYDIYNVGVKTAFKVHLDDRHSFPTQSFEILRGQLSVRFERIPAGTNITHSVVIRPRQYGIFNYTAAYATYQPSETVKEQRGVSSNAPGEGYIYRLKEYERKFSPKYPYWIVFFLLISPTTLGAFYVFNSSKRRYDNELAQAKKAKTT